MQGLVQQGRNPKYSHVRLGHCCTNPPSIDKTITQYIVVQMQVLNSEPELILFVGCAMCYSQDWVHPHVFTTSLVFLIHKLRLKLRLIIGKCTAKHNKSLKG